MDELRREYSSYMDELRREYTSYIDSRIDKLQSKKEVNLK